MKDKINKVIPYVTCFLYGAVAGAIFIYLLSWKVGILKDIRLDYFFK